MGPSLSRNNTTIQYRPNGQHNLEVIERLPRRSGRILSTRSRINFPQFYLATSDPPTKISEYETTKRTLKNREDPSRYFLECTQLINPEKVNTQGVRLRNL